MYRNPDGAPSGTRPGGNRSGGNRSGRAPRTRGLLAAAVLVVAIAVAAGAYLIGTQLRDPRAGVSLTIPTSPSITDAQSPGTPPSKDTRSPGSPPSADASSSVPAAFVGSWRGRASDGLASFTIELTIGAGSVGEEVASSANTGTISGSRCERAETLTEAGAERLVFRARLTGGGGCVDEGKSSTVTLRPDGTVDYSTPGLLGGAIAGVLTKG